jgi:hypothetical protein
MEEALLAFLLADAGVVAAVAVNKRGAPCVSWSWREQGSPVPAITLIKVDGARDPLLAGGNSGFVDSHVQVDCWGAYQLDAKQAARAVVAAAQLVTEAATGGVIQGAFTLHEADTFEGETPDRLFRTMLTLRVPYVEG